MMTTDAGDTALWAAAASVTTVLITNLFQRIKTRRDNRLADAAAHKTEAEGDATLLTALTSAFREMAERQADEIEDLRNRVRIIETELLTTRRECEALRAENAELKTENANLRSQVDLKRGEIGNLNQIIESLRRVSEA